MRWIVFFLLITAKVWSLSYEEAQKIVNERYIPKTSHTYTFTPKVDVITGIYTEEAEDLVVAGAEPISFRRFYQHSTQYDPRFGNWYCMPETFAVANFESMDSGRFVTVGERDGTVNTYEFLKNLNGALPSGEYYFDYPRHRNCIGHGAHTHPRNTRIGFRRKQQGKVFAYQGEIADGKGGVRFFNTPSFQWVDKKIVPVGVTSYTPGGTKAKGKMDLIFHPHTWCPYHIMIDLERLPNGNYIKYTYAPWKDESLFPQFRLIKTITALNRNMSKVLGTIDIDYAHRQVKGSDGRISKFGYIGNPNYLGWVVNSSKPDVNYWYENNLLKQVIGPDKRFFTTSYKNGRVEAQYAPVGLNGSKAHVAKYGYIPGFTKFFDGENNETDYSYDSNKRITSYSIVEKGKPIKTTRFEWNNENGTLISKIITDGNGKIFHKQSYEYDRKYNPIKETIGDSHQSYTIHRTYYQNDYNVKEKEWDDFGKLVKYTYVPNTNLVSSEFVYEGSRIRKRTFYIYDDCAIAIKTIVDDGISENPNDLQNVTTRKIKEVTPKYSHPCFGLPEEVREKTIGKNGNEILLRKVRFLYHPSGKIKREDHYDANNTLRYSIQNEYNEKELLISTIDAQSNKTTFKYDRNFNLLSQEGPRTDIRKEWVYDLANRVTEEKIYQSDKSLLTIKNKYDKASRLISKTDESGFETRYIYDVANRLIEIIHPDGSVEKKEYDTLDNLIKSVDAKGYETKTTYNFRNQPVDIFYPDGSSEHFTYHSDGTLHTHIDKNETKTVYTYDIFSNPIKIESYSNDGKCLRTTSATYSAFNKLSETDAEGVITKYSYDFAGRKIAEEKAERKIKYVYDALGRLLYTIIGDTAYHTLYDNNDRVIEKNIKTLSGIILESEKYAYDAEGNRTQVINSKGITETRYDSNGRILEIKDAIGHSTRYNYSFKGGLTTTEINPVGIQTIHIHDSRQNEIETIKKKDNIIQQVQRKFDRNKNIIEELHFVLDGAQLLNKITYSWIYGPNNRIEKLIEPDQKQTTYIYDKKGRLSCKVKPDGVKLIYEYDALGRLNKYSSSDFCYKYYYDKNDRLILVDEGNLQTVRKYHPLGYLTEEQLGNGLLLHYEYDLTGRRIRTQLPDGSDIHYSYRGHQLHQIHRKNQVHTYSERDPEGLLTKAVLPFQLGTLTIEHDPLSRWSKFTSPFYQSSFEKGAYDPRGNLLQYTFTDSLGTKSCTYEYDDLNQLTSEDEHTYQFDSLYNRRKKDNLIHEINNLNQITHDGISLFTYDKNGNLISDGKKHFSYDSLDRLTAIQENGKRITYIYDAFNRRISKTMLSEDASSKQQHYIYNEQLEIGCTDSSFNLEELRVLGEGLGAEIGAAIFVELHGKSYIPIHDHRGCLVVLIDAETKQPENYRYTAFGEELTSFNLSPWRFASKRIDPETGWIYFGKRYYSPSLGRWITTDPQGFVDGPNLYAYLNNSPLIDIDLFGEYSFRGEERTYERPSDDGPPSRFRSGCEIARDCGDVALDFTFPCAHSLFNLPSDAPLWQKAALTLGGAAELAFVFAPPAKIVFSFAERSVMKLTSNAFLRSTSRSIERTSIKATNVAVEKNVLPKSTLKNLSSSEKNPKQVFNANQKWKFPENPADLLPELPRDRKGHIYTSDNIRIRPEKHLLNKNEIFNPRHHGQHYHVEIIPKSSSWNRRKEIEKLKPPGYVVGQGTGFLPGEFFPGIEL